MGYLLAIAICIVAFIVWQVAPFVLQSLRSPLKQLPGPPSAHWFFGNFKVIWEKEDSRAQEKWVEEYGPTIAYQGLFGLYRLWTLDTRALNHVLTHSADYQKPNVTRTNLIRILGAGVLATEGEQHRQQRRIMNPAFGPAQIREVTSIFLEKAMQLRDVWIAEVSKSPTRARVDVLPGLSRTTLDVIGMAGFSYDFNSLGDTQDGNELRQAFKTLLNVESRPPIFQMIQSLVPVLRIIPTKTGQRNKQARKVMQRVGMELIAQKKASLLQHASSPDAHDVEKSSVSRRDLQDRDLLTVLLKANMATDIPDNQRLSDEDVLAQVPTFLIAGHETTATGTTWCLYALTQALEVQKKLRAELRSVATDNPSMDELVALPYLDAVVRETLRLYPPVSMSIRNATKPDLIPLNTPYTDKNGVIHDTVKVAKNDVILVPILAINRAKHIWGEDADEFKPERWEKPPEAIASIPGVWGNILSFLGGPRACIGYRFSLIEMKALLFTLIRAFEIELAVSPEDIGKKGAVVQRPYVKSEPDAPNQMPLILKLVS